MTFIPILAAQTSIVFLVILIISVVSWLVNLVQGDKPNIKKKPPRPAGGGQSELELFLQQVVGNTEAEKPRPAPKPAKPAGERKPQKKQQQSKQRVGNERPGSERPGNEQKSPAERPGQRLSQIHLADSTVGAGMRSHASVTQNDVANSVRRDIDENVLRDIGTDGTVAATINRPAEHPLIQTLRSPQGVRQAIILTEILGRPKSLR